MSPNIKPMYSLEVPERSGRIDLRGFFPRIPEKQVVVDEALLEFVTTSKTKHYTLEQPLKCDVEKASLGGVLSGLLNLTVRTMLNLDQMCAIMVYLGTDGWPILNIKSQEEEINVLIGYLQVGRSYYALMVEHEYNDGKEEINLHMRKPNHKEDDPVLILKIT